MAEQNKELQELFIAVAKLRDHVAGDSKGDALVTDALNSLCRYYNSDPIARAGNYVIGNVLANHPHLHHTETPVEDWGFEVAVSCDNCGEKEKHIVIKDAVDVAAALTLGKHAGCKPMKRAVPGVH